MEEAPVSCWRVLMVANEFNELMTERVTSPGFTLLMLVRRVEEIMKERKNAAQAGEVCGGCGGA